MVRQNPHFTKLKKSYLFAELARTVATFKAAHPHARVINLGIGDTSQPLNQSVCTSLAVEAEKLGTPAGYCGYGPEAGDPLLRESIAQTFYPPHITPEDVFISDGAKCDLGRLQMLFGENLRVGIQDPAYPVYIDSSLMQGHQIISFPCRPENHFFPDLQPVDLLFFCSPNNPTGTTTTHAELETLVTFARNERAIILFDASYACFIDDPSLPKSIYEIAGAEQVAIETSSFSKWAGFTGVRLGWTVVPKALTFDNGKSVQEDWIRLMTTVFNGASLLSQAGGLAALHAPQIDYYRENCRLLKAALPNAWNVYGGEHAPYLWVDVGGDDWAMAQQLLEELHVIVTPGSGFGKEGVGFVRLSAFGPREDILEAIGRFEALSPLSSRR